MCADVAGYSRLMGVDEAGTLAAFKAHRREVIDPLVTKHRGRLVSAAGDGEDYELLFAVASTGPDVDALSRQLGAPVSEIGALERADGRPAGQPGWRHF